jgi:5-methylcytosine-specific restriction enzyme subunit McrC
MAPFLLDMANLFERFVANWLKEHLPPEFSLRVQDSGHYDRERKVPYRIDLVLCDGQGNALAVLDSKYKKDEQPQASDVAQVVTYATKLGCEEAFLVYPRWLGEGKSFSVGRVKVRTVGFPLDGEIAHGGRAVLTSLALALSGSGT